MNQATAGAAVAVSNVDAHADATFSANLGTAAAPLPGTVQITALNNTYKNEVDAGETSGNTPSDQIYVYEQSPLSAGTIASSSYSGASGFKDTSKSVLNGLIGKQPGDGSDASTTARLGAAVGLELDDQSAHVFFFYDRGST